MRTPDFWRGKRGMRLMGWVGLWRVFEITKFAARCFCGGDDGDGDIVGSL